LRATLEEALDLLRGWLSERVLLRCHFESPELALTMPGRLRELSRQRLSVVSDDGDSELSLVLGAGIVPFFGDPGRLPEEALLFREALVCFLGEPESSPFLSFAVVIEGS